MNYSEIKKVDIANCIGVGVSLFVSGCRNHCEGCFNPETWNFNFGKTFTDSTIEEILDACDKPFIKTLTILGGDPMEKENRKDVLNLCLRFRERFGDTKSLWLYSGYLFEVLCKEGDALEVLKTLDVLVDGKFILEKKVVDLKLRGSTNQRILDVRKSLKSNKAEFFDISR